MRFLHYLKAALLLAVLAISIPSQATIWTVTDANDFLAPGTLRFSVDNSSPGDTIMFAIPQSDINLGPLTPTHDLVFIGNGASNTAIDGGGLYQLFSWSSPIQIIMRDLTLKNADASTPGAAINAAGGDLQLYNCVLHDNHSSSNGGAVYIGGTMVARNTNFWNNAANTGGALYLDTNADCDIDTAQFNDNTCLFRGGAVYLNNASPRNAMFDHVTFDNNSSGDDGGAIYKANSATAINFNRCQFTNDTAGSANNGGAIAHANGTMTIDSTQFHNCHAPGNGGGIYSESFLLLTACLVDSNSANAGGGIYGGPGTGTVINTTTFLGNVASTGGGLQTSGSSATITNSTFSDNTAALSGGGIAFTNGASHTVLSTTITQNTAGSGFGGGVYATTASTTVSFENTIVAQNTDAGSNPDISNNGAAMSSNNHNLIGDDTGSGIAWQTGDFVGGAASPLDPLLDPIAWIGSALAHAPTCQSLAVDNAGALAPTNDQAGQPRVGASDIGAIEYQGGPAGGIYVVTNIADNGVGSLRYGVESSCADTIEFSITLTGQTITLTSGQLTTNRNLVILGLGASNITVDAQNASRLFLVSTGDSLEMNYITLANGNVGTNGGCILNNGVLHMTETNLVGNTAGNNGGAIYNVKDATLISCNLISNNGYRGGAYYSNGIGNTFIDTCFFSNNTAGLQGGAISGIGGSATTYDILNSNFSTNSANGDGGGIWLSVGTSLITINSNNFNDNDGTAGTSKGGAIYLFTTTNTTLIDSCDFKNSDANAGGGAVYVGNGDATFGYCIFESNTANNGPGGGLFADNGSGVTVTYSTFLSNQAAHGGGFALQNAGGSNLYNSTLNNNMTVSGDGGAIALDNSFLSLQNSTLSGNISAVSGGGMALINNAQVNSISNTLAFNVAGNTQGEQVYLDGTSLFETEASIFSSGGSSAHDFWNTGSTITSYGNNLVGDTSNAAPFANWAAFDILGGGGSPIDPQLNPLADNGGVTWTHSFPCSSPAVDNGNPLTILPTDQIDQPRLGTPDIGAYERQIASGGSFEVISATDGTFGSLRYAIDSTCVDTITFAPALSGFTFAITGGDMDINRDLVIIGLGSANMTLDAGNNSRFFNIGFLNQVKISGMRLINGNAGVTEGGAIFNGGFLTMNDLRFTGNSANEGGAIYNDPEGNIVADSCKFDLNNATNGGALALFNHNTNSVDFTYSEFFDNTADDGGAIYADSTGTKTFITCEIHDNSSTANGGGVFSQWGAFFADSCSVWNNSSSVGGGIYFSASNGFVVRSSTFFADSSGSDGGAIYSAASAGFIWNNTFSGNHALGGNGGAVYTFLGNIDMNSNTIVQNHASAEGGGYHGSDAGLVLALNNNIIADNTAGSSAPDFNVFGAATVNSGGYNFIGVGDQTGVAVTWDANDITGTVASPLDPNLEPLANNGGPTSTMQPNCGSPVIDAGDDTNAPAADQIGQPRVGQTDIGAFEHQAPATAPTAAISGSAELCRNSIASDSLTVTLTGTPPFNVVITNGTDQTVFSGVMANSFNFLPQDTGTYSIPIVNDASCTNFNNSSGSVQVDASTLAAVITAQTDAACASTDGDATVTASGGSGTYEYLWTNGDTIPLADSIGAGYYMVTVTDPSSGCATVAVAQISNQGAPSLTVNNVDDITCNGLEDGGIDISVSGGSGNYEYLWSAGSPSEDAVGLDAGPAEIRVTDLTTGCVVIQSIMINEPDPISVNVNGTDATCGVADGSATAVVTGGNGGLTYNWSSGGSNATETGLAYGIYTVDVVDQNGCNGTGVVAISEVGAANVQIDSMDRPSCASSNGSIYISANGAGTLSYDWNNGLSTSEDLSNVPAGVYQVEVTDAGGCIGVAGVPLLNARPESPFLCIASVDSATQNNLIGWEKTPGLGIEKFWVYRESSLASIYQKIANVPFDSLSQFIDTVSNVDQQAWRYQVRAIDSCGNGSWLSNSISHRTIHVSGQLKPNGDVVVLWNSYDGFEIDKYYVWRHTIPTGMVLVDSVDYPGHIFIDTPPNYDSLFYRVDVKNPFPCVVTRAAGNNNASKSNDSDLIAGPTGINKEESDVSFLVYPVPSRDMVNVAMDGLKSDEAVLTVYDIEGRVIKANRVKVNGGQVMHLFDFSTDASGIYFLEVWTRDGVYNRKLVIE